MHRVEQRGTGRGLPLATDLAYEGGRVRGRSSTPAADGSFRSFDIDSAEGAVVDDDALQALGPALPLVPGTTSTATVVSASQSRMVPMTLTVRDQVAVDVPAGRFDAWRLEVAGPESTLAFFGTLAAPRRLVRVGVTGSPLEFVPSQ